MHIRGALNLTLLLGESWGLQAASVLIALGPAAYFLTELLCC
jgi:hypothetical protein